MRLQYDKIDILDCILYRNQYENADFYPTC